MCLLVEYTTFIPIATGPIMEVMNYFDCLVCSHIAWLGLGFFKTSFTNSARRCGGEAFCDGNLRVPEIQFTEQISEG